MNLLTFGIITDGQNFSHLQLVIDSILSQNIQHPKILVVGPSGVIDSLNNYSKRFVRHVEFDETRKKAWITRKKNEITQLADTPYVVYMHDYIALCENWYENVEPYLKEDFKVAITEVLDSKGNRFIDWILHPLNYRITDFVTFPNRYLLPYSEQKLQRFQYVPGYFFVASVEFMQRYPLNENLSWGEGEDVEWSFRWRDLPDTYQLIRNARVRLLKDKTASALELKGLRLRVFRLFSCRPFFILHNRFKVDVRQVRRALGLRDKMN